LKTLLFHNKIKADHQQTKQTQILLSSKKENPQKKNKKKALTDRSSIQTKTTTIGAMKNKQPIVPRSPVYFSDEKKKKLFLF
jgi:hypothetical protein